MKDWIGEFKAYNLQDYHRIAFTKFSGIVDLAGKRVLEIGGALPEQIVMESVKGGYWFCVDEAWGKAPLNAIKLERNSSLTFNPDNRYTVYDGDAADIPDSWEGQFDAVFSLAALEHVSRLDKVLERIYYVLKPQGVFFTSFGPIWSCGHGHHMYISKEINFRENNHIPDYSHLLLSQEEFRDAIKKYYPTDIVEQIVQHVFYDSICNRLLASDYRKALAKTSFEEIQIRSLRGREPNWKTLMTLKSRYPECDDFSTTGFELIAEKTSGKEPVYCSDSWTYIDRINLLPSCIHTDSTMKEYLTSAIETSDYFRAVIDDGDKVAGVFTKGDFYRALQAGTEFSAKMRDICNKRPHLLVENQYSGTKAIRREAMNIHRQNQAISRVPLVNDEGELQGIVVVG